MNFEQLFKQIPRQEIYDNVFSSIGALAANDFYAITAGKIDHYNSMIGSGGGLGLFFKKPTTWSLLRADRYTLEMIEKEQTYTLSYFPNEYREQVLILGRKSGRDSEKMNEVELTAIQSPSGYISFTQARLIVECKLQVITTIIPDDLYAQEAKDYVQEEYEEENHYRKIAFGEITKAWIKK